jgi:hypothetical protein
MSAEVGDVVKFPVPHLPEFPRVRSFVDALWHPTPAIDDVRLIGENAAGSVVTGAPGELNADDFEPADRTELVRQVQDLVHQQPAFSTPPDVGSDAAGHGIHSVHGPEHSDLPPNPDHLPGLDDIPG